MPNDDANRGDELRDLGWREEDVRRYEQLWEYRRRWGAINLERIERQFLLKAESELSHHQSCKPSQLKSAHVLSHNRSKITPNHAPINRTHRSSPTPLNSGMETDCFVALDFETADQGRDSACSIALVRVERHEIVHREHRLIRPPRRTFVFTSIHGISWTHVAKSPSFGELWPELFPVLDGARFIAAHNASFDANVMQACCHQSSVSPPLQPYLCTVQLARNAWNIRPTKLPDVCRHLNLNLKHHDALSDAEACANIVLAAIRDGAL